MSVVRPSPLNYSRLREEVRRASVLSAPLTPVFGDRGWHRPRGAQPATGAGSSQQPPGSVSRRVASDTCLSVQRSRAPVYRQPPSHESPPRHGLSPRQQQQQQHRQGTRRRLFDAAGSGEELELLGAVAMMNSTEARQSSTWTQQTPVEVTGKPADKCFPKHHSTTTCGIENVRAYSSKGIDYFCRVQNLEQKSLLECNAEYKPEARSKLLGSPTSQRSQDSGFSDSGESNCDSQSDDHKRERRVRFEKRSLARTLTRMMRGGSPARRPGKSAGDTTFPKPILCQSKAASSTSLSASLSTLPRTRSRPGHTPKSTRFSRANLEVLDENSRLNTTLTVSCEDISLASRNGPLTSSPMRADHVLQCSAIERELDSMLAHADQPDRTTSQQAIASCPPRASLNDTTIDFSPVAPRHPCVSRTSGADVAGVGGERGAAGAFVTLRSASRQRHLQRRWSQMQAEGRTAASLPRRPRSEWNLAPGLDDVQTQRYCSLPRELQSRLPDRTIRIDDVRSPSVRLWLQRQSWEVDVECMNTLQSKSVISDMSHLLALAARNARTNIRDIQVRAKTVSREFTALFNRMEELNVQEVPKVAQTVTEAIQSFVREYEHSHPEGPASHVDNLDKLRSLMEKMLEYVKSCGQVNRTFKVDDLVQVLTSLAQAFNHLVDLILGEEVKVLLTSLSPERDILCLKLGLRSLTSVGLDGGRLCRILCAQGAVARLLTLVTQTRRRQLRPQALRALATVCCVSQGIKAFEKADGLPRVTGILTDPRSTEEERSECAGVIAQVTSPWVDSIHHVRGISDHAEDIIRELTGLAATTASVETLLLATAALANLTFLNIGAVRLLLHNGAAKVLVTAASTGDGCSLFLKDQVATILANMASIAECHEEVLRSGGLPALLDFLSEKIPSGGEPSDPTVAVAERVQQKAAIALSRLCVRRQVALQVVESGGLQRLIQLCRNGSERNHSDGVLVACLATLRKMASACGLDVFKNGNGLELVEPRLLESFLLCSSKQESYV